MQLNLNNSLILKNPKVISLAVQFSSACLHPMLSCQLPTEVHQEVSAGGGIFDDINEPEAAPLAAPSRMPSKSMALINNKMLLHLVSSQLNHLHQQLWLWP